MLHGQAAGDSPGVPWGAWLSLSHSDFEDDFPSTAFEADRGAITMGFDVSPFENYVFGVALGYENTDIDSSFNQGEADVDTYSVVPYMGGQLSEAVGVDFDLGFDIALGYSNVDIDQFRLLPGTTTRVTSSTDSDRLFISGNVTAGKGFGNLYLSGMAGLLVARDEVDGFTESDGTIVPDDRVELGQVSIGGDVSYAIGWFAPYASLVYENQFEDEELVTATAPQPANDNDNFRLGLGFRAFLGERWSGMFEWNTVLSREDFEEDTFMLQVRGEF
jgi:outer membrane autotransporter protein